MNKETIKEFLKPDWRKILTTLVICLLLFLYNSITYFCPPGADCVGIFTTKIFLDNTLLILPWYFIIFPAYFLSCLIISVYDKFKVKKMNLPPEAEPRGIWINKSKIS